MEELKRVLNINNPVYKQDKDGENNLKSIEEIVGDYVFTSDNFFKIILILLRIRANVPVIIMGETGCGKTSLIRKLSELMNNGECNMEILNMHAGITHREICYFLFDRYDERGRKIRSLVEEA